MFRYVLEKDTEQFDYYSNNVIPYRYLEVVARKYVLTYNCLELYIDTKTYMGTMGPLGIQREIEGTCPGWRWN